MIKLKQKQNKLVAISLAVMLAAVVLLGLPIGSAFAAETENSGHWEYFSYVWNQNYGTDVTQMPSMASEIKRIDSRITEDTIISDVEFEKFYYRAWGAWKDTNPATWCEVNGMSEASGSGAYYHKVFEHVVVSKEPGRVVFNFDDCVRPYFYSNDDVRLGEIKVTVTFKKWVVDEVPAEPSNPQTVLITFNANGGVIDSGSSTSTAESGKVFYNITQPTVSYAEHTFVGWSYSTTDWQPINIVPSSNTTVYARWIAEGETAPEPEPIPIIITFNANGGIIKSGNLKQTLFEDIIYLYSDFSFPTLSREGYEFKGWSFDSDNKVILDTSKLFEFVNDTTLYAVWEVKSDKVDGTFIVNNGATKTEYSIKKQDLVVHSVVVEYSYYKINSDKIYANSDVSVSVSRIDAYDKDGNKYTYAPGLGITDLKITISTGNGFMKLDFEGINGEQIVRYDFLSAVMTVKTPISSVLTVDNNVNDTKLELELKGLQDLGFGAAEELKYQKLGIKPTDYIYIFEISPSITLSAKVYEQLVREDGTVSIQSLLVVLDAYGVNLFNSIEDKKLAGIDTSFKFVFVDEEENWWQTKVTVPKIVMYGSGTETFMLNYVSEQEMENNRNSFAKVAGGTIMIDTITARPETNSDYVAEPSEFQMWLDQNLDIQNFGDLFPWNWHSGDNIFLKIVVFLVFLLAVYLVIRIIVGIVRAVRRRR